MARMFKPQRADLKRYGVSVVAVSIATLLTLAIEPLFGGKAPLAFFTGAVIGAAAFGVGPGLVAAGLSVVSAWFLFPAIFVLVLAHSSLTFFALIGVCISVVMGRLQKINAALRQSQVALQRANEQLSAREQLLSKSNEELKRFAYALAHDLNTPVRAIGALTDLLVQRNASRLDDSSKECAGLIIGKVQRMQAMIKGLLDYAAAEKSPIGVYSDAEVALRKAMQDLDSFIQSSGAEITVTPLPIVAMGENQLVRVFSNLLSNSMKYCHRGRKPIIQISVVEQGGDYAFSVKDNGIGLEMKYAESIFEMFKRLHGDQYEGSGIGLALCKTVIESHGGRIWLESEIGDGTTFHFTVSKAQQTSGSGKAGERLLAARRAGA